MNKILRNKTVLIVISMVIFLCLASAFAPLWMNQCAHGFTEEEVNVLVPLMAGNKEEKMVRMRDFLSKRYVPCGVGNVSPEEKEEIANHYSALFDEPFSPLRTDLDYIYMEYSNPVYYFQAYTFFYIPSFCIRSVLPGRLLETYHPTCPVLQESVSP